LTSIAYIYIYIYEAGNLNSCSAQYVTKKKHIVPASIW